MLGLVLSSASAQDTLRVEFPDHDYETALADAEENYDGALFIYFYHPDDKGHELVAAHTFKIERLARYVNTNFSRLAVNTATSDGLALLSRFKQNPDVWPVVVVFNSKNKIAPQMMQGWETIQKEDDAMLTHWLSTLRRVKN
ncbi:MAG: hypothetical protein RhofKO_12850 [Rhodothermales bacterium]